MKSKQEETWQVPRKLVAIVREGGVCLQQMPRALGRICFILPTIISMAIGCTNAFAQEIPPPSGWAPTEDHRVVEVNHGAFIYIKTDVSDLQHAIPGGTVGVQVLIEQLPGQGNIVPQVFEQDPSSTLPVAIRPSIVTPAPQLVSTSSREVDGLKLSATEYILTVDIDDHAEAREYPLRISFQQQGSTAAGQQTADYLVPVGYPEPAQLNPGQQHPLQIQPEYPEDPPVITGGAIDGSLPLRIYNGFHDYNVQILGIELHDDQHLIESIPYDPSQPRLLKTGPRLPQSIPYHESLDMTIPVQAVAVPWQQVFSWADGTPDVQISVHYSDGYREGFHTIPYQVIDYHYQYYWPLTLIGLLLGSIIGVAIKRRLESTPGWKGVLSQVLKTSLVASLLVLLAHVTQVQLLVAGDKQVLSYSSPMSALVCCAAVGVSNKRQLLGQAATSLRKLLTG